MRKIGFVFACLSVVLGLGAATPGHAQTFHSFVAGNGSGTTCTLAAPCSNIQAAVTATNAGGIVSCLDQAANSDGATVLQVNITKSITIDCAGTSAAAYFVTINGTGIVVTLRNLQINMVETVGGSGGVGIDFQTGAELFVEHCVIEGWNAGLGAAIHFAPTSGTAKLHVTDSVIKNNGVAAGGAGIFVAPIMAGAARVVVERTVIDNNTYGVFANGSNGTVLIEVKDSTITNNAINGIWAFTTGGQTASIMVDHSASNYNGGSGAAATGNGAFVSLSDTTVVGNATGLSTASSGAIGSYDNNRINGNTSAGVTPTGIAFK